MRRAAIGASRRRRPSSGLSRGRCRRRERVDEPSRNRVHNELGKAAIRAAVALRHQIVADDDDAIVPMQEELLLRLSKGTFDGRARLARHLGKGFVCERAHREGHGERRARQVWRHSCCRRAAVAPTLAPVRAAPVPSKAVKVGGRGIRSSAATSLKSHKRVWAFRIHRCKHARWTAL